MQELEKIGIAPGASFRDPVTGRMYEYTVVRVTNYRLCATFVRASPSEVPLWRHPAGHACFALDASQEVPQVPSPW